MLGNETHDPVLDRYYVELSKVKIFSPDEERELFREYLRRAGEEDPISSRRRTYLRTLLIESCLKLVFSLAKRYWMDRDSHTLQALISAGNVGLVEAVEKFDPERGTRFASYASFWILMHIRGELTTLKEVVQPSSKERKLRMRSAAARRKLNGGKEPTEKRGSQYSSLDTLKENTDLYAYNIEHSNNNSTLLLCMEDSSNLYARWFRFLTVREQYVLRAYYGLLNNGDGLKLRQIATYLGLSSERIRQIKVAALAKLKKWLTYDGVSCVDDVF